VPANIDMLGRPQYELTHLSNSQRIELACDYMVHEFRKIFREISHEEAYKAIAYLKPKRDDNEDERDIRIRDFWNLFCAMSNTWRLKDLCSCVTAVNFAWKKEDVHLPSLYPESRQGWMNKLNPYNFDQAILHLEDRSNLEEALKESEREQAKHPKGNESDPLIAVKRQSIHLVRDGNGRLSQRIVKWVAEGKRLPYPTMSVWAGQGDNGPRNYWVPTDHLYVVKKLIGNVTEDVLGAWSLLALTEYRNRVKRDP